METNNQAIAQAAAIKLTHFRVCDKVTRELYGFSNFVLNVEALRMHYYTVIEKDPNSQNWEMFLEAVENRIETIQLKQISASMNKAP